MCSRFVNSEIIVIYYKKINKHNSNIILVYDDHFIINHYNSPQTLIRDNRSDILIVLDVAVVVVDTIEQNNYHLPALRLRKQ